MTEPICITSQCGLCQLDVAYSEEVAVYSFRNWKRMIAESLCDGLVCDHADGLGISCHPECLRIAELECSERLMKATRHTFQSTVGEKHRRRNWMLDCLSSKLQAGVAIPDRKTHVVRLPPELCRLVAEQLLSYYATTLARSLWKPPEQCRITLDRTIWCNLIHFEGGEYISSLSNFKSQQHPELLFRPSTNIPVRLYTRENHLGLTKALFSNPDYLPVFGCIPNTWWRTFDLSERNLTILGESDGIKLRGLTVVGQNPVAWSVPPIEGVRFAYINLRYRGDASRMVAFSCNDPLITGYSILWNYQIAMIHAHKDGEDLSFYQLMPNARWLYMPVDQGELITEIYTGSGWIGRDSAIGIRTNKDRCFLAGIYSTRSSRQWALVDQPVQTRSRIFYGTVDGHINILAFENQFQTKFGQHFQQPTSSPHSIITNQEDYFYNSLDLTGLVIIAPCRTKGDKAISGLLLHFADGHRDSVGEVRLDSLGQTLNISEKETVVLGFRRHDGRYPYVSDIATSSSKFESGFISVIRLFAAGRLEWFWSHRQCYVIYEGERSLETA